MSKSFYVIAVNETGYWQDGLLAANNIKAAFGLYLICAGEGTHLCSLSASSRADWLRNVFIYDCDDALADAFAEENENENGGENGTYFNYINVDTYDPRFIEHSCTVDPEDVGLDSSDEDEDDDTTQPVNSGDAEWDYALEYEQGNHNNPSITLNSVYDAYIKEKESA